MSPPPQLVRGILNPAERYAEVLFGVLMALTLTGALRVAEVGELDSRAMFFATLGCNVAWGVVDGVMYVLNSLFEQGRRLLIAHYFHAGPEEGRTPELLAEILPERLARRLSAGELDLLRRRIAELPDLPERPRVHRDDVLGAVGVSLLVVASTFPVALPFLLVGDVSVAMGISRGLSLVLLFLCGFGVARYSGLRPVRLGLAMIGIGALLVGLLTALGG